MSDGPPRKRLDKGKGKGKEADTNGHHREDDDANLPWVEKYRPRGLEDVVSHQDIISTSMCDRCRSRACHSADAP